MDELRDHVWRNGWSTAQVVLQPICKLPDGEVWGLEALTRWQWPDGAWENPEQFVRALEDLEQLPAYTMWVAQAASDEVVPLIDLLPSGWHLSLNITVSCLADPDFAAGLLYTWYQAGRSPEQLVVEITEGAPLHRSTHIIEQLDRLRQAGVGIATDDYGTGYATRALWREYSCDIVKLPREHVSLLQEGHHQVDVIDQAVQWANRRGALVVAEGVENVHVWDRLCRLGVHAGQGYFIARPQPGSMLVADLSRWNLIDHTPDDPVSQPTGQPRLELSAGTARAIAS